MEAFKDAVFVEPYAQNKFIKELLDKGCSSDVIDMGYLVGLLDNIARNIEPLLERGEIVIADRYINCAKVYASLKNIAFLDRVDRLVPEPDLTIYFRLDAKTSYERIVSRAKQERRTQLDPHETPEILAEMVRKYDEIYKDMPNVVRIDASKSKEEVARQTIKAVREAFRHKAV